MLHALPPFDHARRPSRSRLATHELRSELFLRAKRSYAWLQRRVNVQGAMFRSSLKRTAALVSPTSDRARFAVRYIRPKSAGAQSMPLAFPGS